VTAFIATFRGFVKYKRAKNQYRPAEERVSDWDEIYNHKGVMKGIQVQAARCATYFMFGKGKGKDLNVFGAFSSMPLLKTPVQKARNQHA
jgi:hypothetical protein